MELACQISINLGESVFSCSFHKVNDFLSFSLINKYDLFKDLQK
jgi:hypothetical protein